MSRGAAVAPGRRAARAGRARRPAARAGRARPHRVLAARPGPAARAPRRHALAEWRPRSAPGTMGAALRGRAWRRRGRRRRSRSTRERAGALAAPRRAPTNGVLRGADALSRAFGRAAVARGALARPDPRAPRSYSIAASLPCARLARRAEVDARRARGGAGTAALGFAVATREVGGGGWLVLDGSRLRVESKSRCEHICVVLARSVGSVEASTREVRPSECQSKRRRFDRARELQAGREPRIPPPPPPTTGGIPHRSGAPAYDSAPPLRFEGGAEALALAPAACCFGALSVTVHYARAPVASAPPPPPPRARTSDRAATARPGPPSGLSLLLARAPPNADAAAANVTGPSAAPRAAAAASSSSLDARALPGRLAPGRRRAAPPGPRSFDPANRATPGGASPGAPTGVCDAPFGLALAARHATAAEDARARASPPAAASTPPFASRSPPAGGLERAPAPRGSSRTAPAAGSPPFAALAAAGRAAQPRAEPRRPRAPWVNRTAPGATTPPALGGNAAAGRPPRALARVSRAAPSSADDPWVARRGAVRIAAADRCDPGAPVPLAPLAHRAKVDHAASPCAETCGLGRTPDRRATPAGRPSRPRARPAALRFGHGCRRTRAPPATASARRRRRGRGFRRPAGLRRLDPRRRARCVDRYAAGPRAPRVGVSAPSPERHRRNRNILRLSGGRPRTAANAGNTTRPSFGPARGPGA